jgi:predicted secreted protein
MAIVGYGGGVYLGDTPTKVAEIASWSLDTDAEDIDITSFDSNGWRERMQGIKEWSGSFEGNFKPEDTTGQAALINAWLNGQKVKLELQVNQNVKFTGEAYITLSIETPVDDKASFSVDFSGTGPLTATLGTGV